MLNLMSSGYRRHRVLIVTCLLLVIAASRFTRLNDIEMELDEVWSIWQTFGTPQQILQWTPFDWTPTYYLILGAWKSVVGIHPDALRVLSALVFLPGCGFIYQFMRRLKSEIAGLLAMLTYAALGYGIFLSLQVRAYTFVYMLMPLLLWLTHRYFDRPNWRRAIALAACLVTVFYFYLPSALGFVMLGIYTLMIYGRAIWRWWLPGVLALIPALPEVGAKIGLTISRTQATSQLVTMPLPETINGLYQSYTGYTYVLWVALFLVAAALIFYRQRHLRRMPLALLVWTLLGPIMVYYLNPLLGFTQQPRYSFWVMLGIALWIAWGLSYLPRTGLVIASAMLVVTMFAPLPIDDYQYIAWSMSARFDWLNQHIRWGDVIVVDPNCDCPSPETWDYFVKLYFPDGGLEFVDDPGEQRRVFYVVFQGRDDVELSEKVRDHRVFQGFSGPPEFMFQLYEAPPDVEGIPYANGMRFHGFDIMEDGVPLAGRLVKREGEPVRVRLWWSADHSIDLDYSVGLHLVRARDGWLADQADGPPQVTDGPQATSQWTTDRYYIEERELHVPYPTRNPSFDLYLAVYQWWDNVRISAPGLDDNGLLLLRSVAVTTW